MKFIRQSRLLKPTEFKRVFQRPIRSGDDSFRILARTNDTQCHRLGMAVSKKSCRKAVGRNRIKRVVRESFRAGMTGQKPGNTLDFVVLPTAQATHQNNQVLIDSLSAHWQKLCKRANALSSTAGNNSKTT